VIEGLASAANLLAAISRALAPIHRYRAAKVNRRESARRIEAKANQLIGAFGPDAYDAARTMQRRAHDGKERRYWRDMARAIARMTGKTLPRKVTSVFGRRDE
jgi:hypothetical protein